jgi:hypothetical protein
MYKIEQLLKPLMGTVSQSGSPERGHGLVSETSTFGPSRPRHCSVLRHARFKLDSRGFGLFPYPTPRRPDAPPDPDSANQTPLVDPKVASHWPGVYPVIGPQPKSWRSGHGLGNLGKPPVAETFKQLLLASRLTSRSAQRLGTSWSVTFATVRSSANPGLHLRAPCTSGREMIRSAQYSERN